MCILGYVNSILGVEWEDFGAILGHVRAILATLMPSWEYNGNTLGLSWAILGHLGAILGPSWGHLGAPWGSWGVLGPTLGFRIYKVKFDHKNAYLFEMPKSLSRYACAVKTPA